LADFRAAILAVSLATFLDGSLILDYGIFVEGIFFLAVENVRDKIFFAILCLPGSVISYAR
jgi:hypothetical protein